jgi:hypothetical protein
MRVINRHAEQRLSIVLPATPLGLRSSDDAEPGHVPRNERVSGARALPDPQPARPAAAQHTASIQLTANLMCSSGSPTGAAPRMQAQLLNQTTLEQPGHLEVRG